MIAAVNHGVATPERSASLAHLLSQLDAVPVPTVVSTCTPGGALEGAVSTLRLGLRATADRILYIEDDGYLAPDADERLAELLAGELPNVLWLHGPKPAHGPATGQWFEEAPKPAGAVALLLSRDAAQRAIDYAPRVWSAWSVVEEMMWIGAGDGAPCVELWPSLVQHRGDIPTVHGWGGARGCHSPSFRARYERGIP